MSRSEKKEAELFLARHLLILKEMKKGLIFGREVVADAGDKKEGIDLGAVTGTFRCFYVM